MEKFPADDLQRMRRKGAFALHIHWDGSVPPEDLFALAQRKGRTLMLPEKDVAGNPIPYASERDRIIDSAAKLEDFQQGLLSRYDIVDVFAVPTGFMQTPDDLHAMALAHSRYLREENIPYAEPRFAPQYHTREGLSLDEVIAHAVEGFREGHRQTGVRAPLIITIGREAEPEQGVAIADAALRAKERFPDDIVALDLACYEPPFPPERHYGAFARTFGSGLKRTVHAGEMCDHDANVKNIYTALTELCADGLGHATPLHAYIDAEYEGVPLATLARDAGVRLESNPISNQRMGFIDDVADLHLDSLLAHGLAVTINPDDPHMWPDGHLAHNLLAAERLYGESFVDQVVEHSVRAAWGLTAREKERYLADFRETGSTVPHGF